ncbi:lamin tail domain-containing protein [Salinimicrobium sediminilitoris]|uniref:lamin tail domain-containing protein n=1 Tax=Salinimicrobium sediminilitoris TaxID=2876715 RepID=UPI001E5251BE|nr:lamin tail domain-containing protein [Salinimicrobium sediminilitoris]MCC8358365.1 lamin tail domain-containing protein [Salinimicrobium sediminilitoris]
MANQLVDLSKNGSLGVNSENAFASLGYGVDLAADFCNGFNLQFEAEASGRAGLSANVTDFFEAIVEIEAGAEVGLQIAAQLSPKLLDEIGLIASVQAYLKAYIRARLELRLTLEKIIENVGDNSSTIQLQIFKKFVEQLEVGVGVEANAQVAITAAAEIVCRGRLMATNTEKAGFDFRLNAEAAFMFGAGFDFFTMSRFENITEFFRDSKDILLKAVKEETADQQLLDDDQKKIVFLVWDTVLDTIIDASASEIGDKRKLFYNTISEFSYQFLFDQINKIFEDLINLQTRQLITWLDDNEDLYIDDINEILVWLEKIEQDWKQKTNIFKLLPHLVSLVNLLDKLEYDQIAPLKNIISHAYFLGYLIDDSNRDQWKNIPEFTQGDFQNLVGRSLPEITSENDCYDYLDASCIEEFLQTNTNNTVNRIKFLVDRMRANGSRITKLFQLLITLKDEQSRKELLDIGIDVLEHLLNDEISNLLENEFRPVLENSTDFGEDFVQVLLDNIHQSYTSVFIGLFRKVFVENGTKKDIDQVTTLALKFLINILGKNVKFLVHELLEYSARNITDSITQCESRIRGGSLNNMALRLQNKVEDQIDAVVPYDLPDDISSTMVDKMLRATNQFLLDILAIARTSMGTETWTEDRIAEISGGLEYVIFNPESNHLNFQTLTADQIENKLQELNDCDFLPDFSKEELAELMETLQTIGLTQLKAFLLEMPVALAIYLLKLLKILFVDFIIEILDALWAKLKDLLERIEELIEEFKEKIEALIEEIAETLERLVEAVDELYNKTKEAIALFFEDLIRDIDFAELHWIVEPFVDAYNFILGNESEEDKAKKFMEDLKLLALNNLENSNFIIRMVNRGKTNNFNSQLFQTFIEDEIIDFSVLEKINFKTIDSIPNHWRTKANEARINYSVSNIKEESVNFFGKDQLDNILRKDLRNMENKFLKLQEHLQHLNELQPEQIKINSPLIIDVANNDTPIYGKYLYINIDFGSLDAETVIKNQLSLHPDKLIDPDGRLALYEWERELRYLGDPENFSPIQIKLLLNGREIDLNSCEIFGSRLNGHIDTSELKHGYNDLFVLVVVPSDFSNKQVQRHVRFYCDHRNQNRPSNSIFIDPIASVINSKGDDHKDAQRNNIEDREKVIIKNNSPNEVKMDHWTLTDAAGHKFIFGDRQLLKPGKKYEIFIGERTLGVKNWKAYHKGRLIAMLNNRGEFLKLEDSNGKVVSHIYTGNPKLNKHIQFISLR